MQENKRMKAAALNIVLFDLKNVFIIFFIRIEKGYPAVKKAGDFYEHSQQNIRTQSYYYILLRTFNLVNSFTVKK